MADIPQTSASERVEKARQFLDRMGMRREIIGRREETTFEAEAFAIIEGLVTPPTDGEQQAIIERIAYENGGRQQMDVYRAMFEAGLQYSHERWEPADRPSQEMMLRWLGIHHFDSSNIEGYLNIPQQFIRREVA